MNNTQNRPLTAREYAMKSLLALERDGRYSNLEISTVLDRSGLSDADRGLYTRLVYGVTERRITLDEIISQYSKLPLDGLDDDVKTALRLGVYQLTWMDRIPEHAAVGESAGLVPRAKTGFVNAVLRSYLRAGKKFDLPDRQADTIKYLSVKYSIPPELIPIISSSCADGETEDLLAALNREPKIALRINTLKISTQDAADRLDGEISEIAPDIVLVSSLDSHAKDGIEAGLWFVQDTASRIAAMAVGACDGECVVDTCACPGGKSFSIAVDMHNSGAIYSFDLHKNKLSLIEKGAARLGINIIKTAARDARMPDEDLLGKADRVLCDAPCSGLGVIAKKPDIRYKDARDISRLPDVQYGVLCGAAQYVKDGGVLVYSTCTLNRAENDDVVVKFLAEHGEFTLDSSSLLGGMRTFFPHKDGCDGFFAARMIKKK